MNWSSIFSDYWRELLALLAAAIIAFLFWLYWPKRIVSRLPIPNAKERSDVEDNFRKTAGQLIGGAAVLLGAGFAYLQFQQQQRAAHDLLISNQVSKGFEQFGSEKIEIRLGGIYALEGVMNTSEQYHKPVLEALSAFVRDGTKNITDDPPPATDIQAALTVIGRRVAGRKQDEINLSNAYIPKAGLANANLAGAYFLNTNLDNAGLVNTNLAGARLLNTNLRWAFFYNTNLAGARLDRAKLNHAQGLTQQQLDQACGRDVELDPPLTIKPCH